MSLSVSYRLSRINSIFGIIKLIGLLKVSNKTINGFDVLFKNSSGTNVSRTFDFIAKGF